MAIYLSNAFSLNMVNKELFICGSMTLNVVELSLASAKHAAQGATSVVGHADTAAVFSSVLGLEVPMNRQSLQLAVGDELLVGQYVGPRLPEGTTELPEGASITWMLVSL